MKMLARLVTAPSAKCHRSERCPVADTTFALVVPWLDPRDEDSMDRLRASAKKLRGLLRTDPDRLRLAFARAARCDFAQKRHHGWTLVQIPPVASVRSVLDAILAGQGIVFEATVDLSCRPERAECSDGESKLSLAQAQLELARSEYWDYREAATRDLRDGDEKISELRRELQEWKAGWPVPHSRRHLGRCTKAELQLVLKHSEALRDEAKEALSALDQCSICMDRARSTVFLPCRHQLACAECGIRCLEERAICPLCRSPVSRCVEIRD